MHFKINDISLHPESDSLAQLVEHDTLNVGVQGSIPWRVTKAEMGFHLRFFIFYSLKKPEGIDLTGEA